MKKRSEFGPRIQAFRGMVRSSEKQQRVARYALRVTRCLSKLAILWLIIILLSPYVCRGDDTALKVRKPVFAGSFYPADKATLSDLIDGYLKEVEPKSTKITGHVFGVIAPHAGYEYSGKVAAYAYSQLKGKGYKKVARYKRKED